VIRGILGEVSRWRDWYEQGTRDLERARLDVRFGYFEWACFTAQQAAEKRIKALCLSRGLEAWGHSLVELSGLLPEDLRVPTAFLEGAQTLDLNYIPSRCPNGFAAGKPADYFSHRKAEEAMDAAGEIFRFCQEHLPEGH
jgi:HEPN domain-containing protein